MVSGQKTLHAIDTAIVRARNDVAKASTLPARISGSLVALRREENLALGEISRLRLDLIEAGKHGEKLGYVDRQAAKLLAAHERTENRLEIKAQQIEVKISTLESERRAQEKNVTTAISAYDKAAAACQKKLLADPEYIALITKVETFEATTERAAHKLDVAHQDEAEKGEPYRSDVFFAYLQKRRYGQKDAKGWTLTKLLDRWVARLCDYQTAAVNYKRLKAIPARLETHLENLEMQAQNARDALKLSEQKMLVAQGVEAARKASILAQTKLEKIDAKIAQQEDKHMAVRAEQADVTSGKSGPYAQAIELLSRTLKGKDLRSLSVIASQTTSDDDDCAVKQLSSLRRTGDDLEKDQREASKLLNSQQKSLKELEKVRRKFKQNRYDAPYSQFPSGDLIGALLGQVLIGAITGDGLWGQIRRAQRTVQRSTDIDFGGVDWGEAMRIPRNSRGSRSSRNSRGRNSGWGGGSSRTSRPRAPKISFPKSSGGGRSGGGFRTGGGF